MRPWRFIAGSLSLIALVLALGLTRSPVAVSDVSPLCTSRTLDASASLAGGRLTVSPAPGTRSASFKTQISFLGTPAEEISTVQVVGSRSGTHKGRLLAYSQGNGASFIPDAPFSQGETVTVKAALSGARAGDDVSWQFTVAHVDAVSRSLETPPPPPPPPRASELQRFRTRTDLKPPVVTVTTDTGSARPEDIFLAPYAGPGQYGPMILDSHGELVWFKSVPKGARAADFRAQEFDGHPVLTWWEDPLVADGRRDAGVVIADTSYRDIAIVRAGNGYQPDLHAFRITPEGTALMTVYDAIRCDLSAYGGPADGAVADTVAQELDLHTGLVRFEWHSLDHVALSDSYQPIGSGGTPRSPWDYFHINMISPEAGGQLLIDSRNTWAAYDVDQKSAQIKWRIGGKHSTFALGPDARPAWQHDAVEQPDGTLTFFDNGASPKVHPQSRAIILRLDRQRRSASLLRSFVHPKRPLLAVSQGNFERLPSEDWFVGWGQAPYFSEFAPDGRLLFDAHLPGKYESYTDLKFPWAGAPTSKPSISVDRGSHGATTVRASWNGATAVAQWRLLTGATPDRLTAVSLTPRSGFETTLTLTRAATYIAVEAVGEHEQALGTSATVRD